MALNSSSLPPPTTTVARRGGTTRIGTAHLSTLALVGDDPAKLPSVRRAGRVSSKIANPAPPPPRDGDKSDRGVDLLVVMLLLLYSSHSRSFRCEAGDHRGHGLTFYLPKGRPASARSKTETRERRRNHPRGLP